jgi:lipopolysaccharide export system permease protein
VNLLDRYIGRAVVSGTLIALLVLLAIQAFFSLMTELSSVGTGNYGLPQAFEYVILTLPRTAYDLFPTSALVGSLFGLGQLAANSELVAIRAAGVSVGRIARSVLQVGLIMLVAASAMGEWVAAPAEQYALQMQALAQSNRITFKGRLGFWARDQDRFINIGQILPGGILADIHVYQFDDEHRLKVATEAKRAMYRNGDWLLEDVRQSRVGADGVQVRHLQKLAWKTLISPGLLRLVMVRPENLSARELLRYIDYLRNNGLNAGRYRLAFWMRLAAPLSGMVMLFLSIPFVFGPLRSAAMGQRLVVGVLVGVGYYLFSQMVSHLGLVYGFNAALSAFTPPLVFFLGGMAVLRRVR